MAHTLEYIRASIRVGAYVALTATTIGDKEGIKLGLEALDSATTMLAIQQQGAGEEITTGMQIVKEEFKAGSELTPTQALELANWLAAGDERSDT